MSSYILFELVKALVLLVIFCVYIFFERRHGNHPSPPFFEHIE